MISLRTWNVWKFFHDDRERYGYAGVSPVAHVKETRHTGRSKECSLERRTIPVGLQPNRKYI